MIASIAAAASMRVRSRRSTSVRTASVMIGLVMRASVYRGARVRYGANAVTPVARIAARNAASRVASGSRSRVAR